MPNEEPVVFKGEPAEDTYFSFFLAIGVTFIEFFLFMEMHNRKILPEEAAIAHIGVVIILSTITLIAYKRGKDIRQHVLLTLGTTMFGLLGSIGYITMWIILRIYVRTSVSVSEWFSALFPEEEIDEVDEIYTNISASQGDLAADADDIIPFGDIMALGTEPQKQVALARMTRFFSPSFAPVLRNATNDPNNSIRVLAATSITKIEHQFLETYLELEKKVQVDKPSDEDILTFAKHCDDYAHCGILDPDREQQSREQAISLYQRYLEIKPEDPNVLMALGRAYIQDNQLEKALPMLKQCIDLQDEVPPQMMMWYLECLFKMGKFSEIHEITQRYKEKAEEDELVIREVFGLWNLEDAEKLSLLSWKNISSPMSEDA